VLRRDRLAFGGAMSEVRAMLFLRRKQQSPTREDPTGLDV